MSGAESTNNGWNIVDGDQVTRVYVGNDTDGCTFLDGDVAALFAWFFYQIHVQVEPVTMLNGWRSRASNVQAGGDDGSNHLSGTAGDVNGTRHPYEPKLPLILRGANYRSGWSAEQQAQIRAIMASTGGLISWGLDYNKGWRDAMHFDIRTGTTARQVKAFVATLAPPPEPKPEPTPEEDDNMKVRLYKVTDNGRFYLGWPGGWHFVTNALLLDALRADYGREIEVDIQTAQHYNDTFAPGVRPLEPV